MCKWIEEEENQRQGFKIPKSRRILVISKLFLLWVAQKPFLIEKKCLLKPPPLSICVPMNKRKNNAAVMCIGKFLANKGAEGKQQWMLLLEKKTCLASSSIRITLSTIAFLQKNIFFKRYFKWTYH